ncbi:hypothetical protein FB45DRAFT_1066225 [Roridomyces roridus]|uniref:Hydrophobin n=1 Tax=Roridomyces roridus TaxID=1738132 RepID=A0AAD7F9H3_9AGAR|nr:hypothetical protein FB45DRAFT_1066225 [Roridomyces roridus]
MLYSLARTLLLASLLPAILAAPQASSCPAANLECCASVVPASDPRASQLLGLFGVAVDGNTPIGLNCSPASQGCSVNPVCCQNNSFGGLFAVGTGLKRADLVTLVQRQQDLWPTNVLGRFQSHKTNVKNLRDALLCPGSRFTTDKPIMRAERAPATAVAVVGAHSTLPSIPSLRNSAVLASLPMAGACKVKLLIDDVRSIDTEKIKLSQEIQVPVQVNLSGHWQASSEDVWRALQGSISPIEGPARVGMEDPENAGYIIYFAKLLGPDEQTESAPVLLNIPQSGCLNLIVSRIDSAMKASTGKRVRSASPDSRSETPVGKKIKSEVDALSAGELLWISEVAENTPGFNEFKQNQHRRLCNAERVKQWNYAASFSRAYYKLQDTLAGRYRTFSNFSGAPSLALAYLSF